MILTYKDLTEAQQTVIAKWWDKNDPNCENYEYADNSRYAVKGNSEQEAAYEKIRDGGCCGFCDVELEVTDENGTHTLLFGFNYGH